jgi:hypothetical protein
MRLIRIDAPTGAFQHLVVRVAWPSLASEGPVRPGLRRHFVEMLVAIAGVIEGLPLAAASVRLVVEPGAPPTSLHCFTAAAGDEASLRAVAACFMRLDGILGARVSTPTDAAEAMAEFLPPRGNWRMLDAPPLVIDGARARPDLGFGAMVGALLARAEMRALPFAAATFALRRAPGEGLMRALAKEAAVVARAVGMPAAVAEAQVRQARALTGASWHLMEAFACPSEDAGELERAARASIGGVPALRPWRDAVELRTSPGLFADAFDLGVHPALLGDAIDPAGDADAATGFVDAATVNDLMSAPAFWRNAVTDGDPLRPLDLPVARLRRSVGAGPGRGGASGPMSGGSAGPGAPGAPYVFVSYARRDRERIDGVIEAIRASGVSLWIDDALTPGDEWDERLESALLGSVGLLAFVSDDYARSKWCRRELKFADVMDKPIYAARWSVEPLGGGLDIIFASLQFVHAGAADPAPALVRALKPLVHTADVR